MWGDVLIDFNFFLLGFVRVVKVRVVRVRVVRVIRVRVARLGSG